MPDYVSLIFPIFLLVVLLIFFHIGKKERKSKYDIVNAFNTHKKDTLHNSTIEYCEEFHHNKFDAFLKSNHFSNIMNSKD